MTESVLTKIRPGRPAPVHGSGRPRYLDVLLRSVVRYSAVRAGDLDPAAVQADFRALGQPGAPAPGLGLLASLS